MSLESFGDRRNVPKRSPVSSAPVSGERNFIVESSPQIEQSMPEIVAAFTKIKSAVEELDSIEDRDTKLDTAADLRSELVRLENAYNAEYSRIINREHDMQSDIPMPDFKETRDLILAKIQGH